MKKYPSILHIIDTLGLGGAERVAVMNANAFSKKGHKVGLMYFIHTPLNLINSLNKGVQVYYFDRKGKFNIFRKKE